METLSFISFAHIQSHLIPNNIIRLLYVCQVLLRGNSKGYSLNPTLAQAITFSTSLQQPKAIDKEYHNFHYFQLCSLLLLVHLASVNIHTNYSLLQAPEDTAGFACSRIFPI